MAPETRGNEDDDGETLSPWRSTAPRGHARKLARRLGGAGAAVLDVTVDLHDIEVVDQQLWNALAVADTVVFGCPTYRGGPSSVVKGVAEYFSLLAVQHGMPWANVDLLPGWWWAGASISDLNRLGGWLGVMSQSNGGSDLQTDPRESDLLTAEHLDARVAEVARLLRSGRTQLAQRDMASAGAHVSTDGEVGGSTLPAVSRDR